MPTFTAEESSLSSWAGPYVTEMLGRGQALAGMPYQAYMGPLTAGQSTLQDTAFQGLAGLNIPTNQQMTYNPMSFTAAGMPEQFMSPYIQGALDPQYAAAQRQADIANLEKERKEREAERIAEENRKLEEKLKEKEAKDKASLAEKELEDNKAKSLLLA